MVSVEKQEIIVLDEDMDDNPRGGGGGGAEKKPTSYSPLLSLIYQFDTGNDECGLTSRCDPPLGQHELDGDLTSLRERVLLGRRGGDPTPVDGDLSSLRERVLLGGRGGGPSPGKGDLTTVRERVLLSGRGGDSPPGDGDLTSQRERVLLGLQTEDLDYLASSFTCRWIEGRGRTLIANRQFRPGDYVIEYKGEFSEYDEEEFTRKEENYAANDEACCVMHVLASDGNHYVIDATREFTHGRARLINHARNPNLAPYQPMHVDGVAYRVAFYATELIEAGDELFWDYFSGEDPAQFIPMLLSDGTLRKFPKQLLWVYSIRTRDKQVIVQPSALAKWTQQQADPTQEGTNQSTVPSSPETEVDTEKEINNNEASVPNLAGQSTTSSQRKPRICTICFKVCKKLSTHIQTVHGITELEERRSILQQSKDLTSTVLSSTPEVSLCRLSPPEDSTGAQYNVLPPMKGRRVYPCPICGKVLKKLSSHLRLVHKLDGEKKLCVLRQVREVRSQHEVALRHSGWRAVLASRRGRQGW